MCNTAFSVYHPLHCLLPNRETNYVYLICILSDFNSCLLGEVKYCSVIALTQISKLNYSQLSLSRLRLSRITAYLEEKIWSLL